MKVCVIANSHVNMLLFAAKAGVGSEMDFTFFGAPASMLRGLTLRPDKSGFIAETRDASRWLKLTARATEISFADYDAFVLVDLGMKQQRVLNLFKDFQPHACHVGGQARLISERAFVTAAERAFDHSLMAHLLRQMQRVKQPIILVFPPFPSERLTREPDFEWLGSAKGRGAMAWVNAVTTSAWERFANARGCDYIAQPPATIGRQGLTLERFSVGSERVTGKAFSSDDSQHMNAAMGEIMLEQIVAVLHRKDLSRHHWSQRIRRVRRWAARRTRALRGKTQA